MWVDSGHQFCLPDQNLEVVWLLVFSRDILEVLVSRSEEICAALEKEKDSQLSRRKQKRHTNAVSKKSHNVLDSS